MVARNRFLWLQSTGFFVGLAQIHGDDGFQTNAGVRSLRVVTPSLFYRVFVVRSLGHRLQEEL